MHPQAVKLVGFGFFKFLRFKWEKWLHANKQQGQLNRYINTKQFSTRYWPIISVLFLFLDPRLSWGGGGRGEGFYRVFDLLNITLFLFGLEV